MKLTPFVKWAGGKRQLLDKIIPLIPEDREIYIEPFVGGGAVFFEVLNRKMFQRYIISDVNKDLIHCYLGIQGFAGEIIDLLKKMENEEAFYYFLRKLPSKMLSSAGTIVRFLYLNRTCYNGLYRVNSKGKFNVPFGKYKNPKICNEDLLLSIQKSFMSTPILILSEDIFSQNIIYQNYIDKDDRAKRSFVYLDPPYLPVNATSFTKYTKGDFTYEDHRKLANLFKEWDRRGVKLLLSNSDTPEVRMLYRDFEIETVSANRSINSKGSGRKGATELLIRNY